MPPFQPGNPGKPKGARNRRTKVAEEFAQSFLKREGFQNALQAVLEDSTHEHWRWATELMHHYAYGKPIERQESVVDEERTIRSYVTDYTGVLDGVPLEPQEPTVEQNGHAS